VEKQYLWHSDRYVQCNSFDRKKKIDTLFVLQLFKPKRYYLNDKKKKEKHF